MKELMEFRPVIPGIKLIPATVAFEPDHMEETGNSWRSEPNRFYLDIPGKGKFCARDKNIIEYDLLPGADPEWVKLYLNMHMTIALLHQRGIMSFHAGSFSYRGMGIIVSGESFAGKSSIVLSFSLDGNDFLSDDVTTVVFIDGIPHIWPVYPKARLRLNTIDQLAIKTKQFNNAESGSGKYYLDMPPVENKPPLKMIISISREKCDESRFSMPRASEKFSILRSEICMWEILKGMPGIEQQYFGQLMKIIDEVKIIRAVRPENIRIPEFYSALRSYIDRQWAD